MTKASTYAVCFLLLAFWLAMSLTPWRLTAPQVSFETGSIGQTELCIEMINGDVAMKRCQRPDADGTIRTNFIALDGRITTVELSPQESLLRITTQTSSGPGNDLPTT